MQCTVLITDLYPQGMKVKNKTGYIVPKIKGDVIPIHVTKAHRGWRSIAPLILNLSTKHRWVANITLWPLLLWENRLQNPLSRRLAGPIPGLGILEKKKSLLPSIWWQKFWLYAGVCGVKHSDLYINCNIWWHFTWTNKQSKNNVIHFLWNCIKYTNFNINLLHNFLHLSAMNFAIFRELQACLTYTACSFTMITWITWSQSSDSTKTEDNGITKDVWTEHIAFL